jgi:hypothetical protein
MSESIDLETIRGEAFLRAVDKARVVDPDVRG